MSTVQTDSGLIVPESAIATSTAEPDTQLGFTHPDEVEAEVPAFLRQATRATKEEIQAVQEARLAKDRAAMGGSYTAPVDEDEFDIAPRPRMVILKDLRSDDTDRKTAGGIILPTRTEGMQALWPMREMEVVAVGPKVWEWRVGDNVYVSNVKGVGMLLDPKGDRRIVDAGRNGGIWGLMYKKGTRPPNRYSWFRYLMWWLQSFTQGQYD